MSILIKTSKIDKFWNEHRFLSNFWPCIVILDNTYYPSCEHAYQAAKTLNPDVRKLFIATHFTAGDAKRLGQSLQIRNDWEHVKLSIMEDLIRQKFANAELSYQLLLTAPAELIEGNYWHDNFYGECHCLKCKDKPKLNNLGKILMKIRDT